jgi:hypothetical protein
MKLLASLGGDPHIAASQLVFAAAAHALHDLGGTRAKSQLAGQHDADRFFGAIGQAKAVADAFAIEIHVCGCSEGDVGNRAGSHVVNKVAVACEDTCKSAKAPILTMAAMDRQKYGD